MQNRNSLTDTEKQTCGYKGVKIERQIQGVELTDNTCI